ncbi:glycosyltransferase family protein [Desulfuromonas versatilis]|uniref:hypothetical protein n=1 Tax=Desulfuromonas versatilis TaxID=2802975 RepID=UPI001C84175E|nr:hypothetical protein [Desulfuromonas versatilis]
MKVLLISKIFPPAGGARAIQIGKVARALSAQGCEVSVICGTPKDSTGENSTRGDQVDFQVDYVPFTKFPNKKALPAKIFYRVLEEINTCNKNTAWINNATEKGKKLIRNFSPDIIMSTSMPFESHFVGLNIKKLLPSIPWISSFSDPWPTHINPPPHNGFSLPVVRELQLLFAKNILNRCDYIHMTNWNAIDLMEQRTTAKLKKKSLVIPHIGRSHGNNNKNPSLKRLSHIGNLSRERVSKPLLLAIKRAHSEFPDHFHGLLMVGNVCDEFRQMVKNLNMESLVAYLNTVSPNEANAIANGSMALLLIEANMPFSPFLPSKFADYISTGKPIIAITPPKSPIRDFSKNIKFGFTCLHDEREIYDSIKRIFALMDDSQLSAINLPSDFSERTIGRSYIQLFKKAIQRIQITSEP